MVEWESGSLSVDKAKKADRHVGRGFGGIDGGGEQASKQASKRLYRRV